MDRGICRIYERFGLTNRSRCFVRYDLPVKTPFSDMRYIFSRLHCKYLGAIEDWAVWYDATGCLRNEN